MTDPAVANATQAIGAERDDAPAPVETTGGRDHPFIKRTMRNRLIWHPRPSKMQGHYSPMSTEPLNRTLVGSDVRRETPRLERAQDGDIAEVVSLLNRAYRGTGDDIRWTTETGLINGDRINETTLRRELVDTSHAMLMVWRFHGDVRGCVWLEPQADGVWYLGSLAIEPQLQNEKLGRRLLESAEKWVGANGGKAIKITVIDVRAALIGWYERRGYRRTGQKMPFPESDNRFGTPAKSGLRFEELEKSIET